MSAIEDAVAALLKSLGVADSAEVSGTPERVAALWRDNLLAGYGHDPAEALGAPLPSTSHAVVTLTRIPFHAICPHHLTPTFGEVHLAYEPSGAVVGLGALERLVFALSRRLALQETLTDDLVDALMTHLDARGAACAIEAHHLCLSLRGREPRQSRVWTRAARGTLIGRPEVLPSVRV